MLGVFYRAKISKSCLCCVSFPCQLFLVMLRPCVSKSLQVFVILFVLAPTFPFLLLFFSIFLFFSLVLSCLSLSLSLSLSIFKKGDLNVPRYYGLISLKSVVDKNLENITRQNCLLKVILRSGTHSRALDIKDHVYLIC